MRVVHNATKVRRTRRTMSTQGVTWKAHSTEVPGVYKIDDFIEPSLQAQLETHCNGLKKNFEVFLANSKQETIVSRRHNLTTTERYNNVKILDENG